MTHPLQPLLSNTILYCNNWLQTVAFYRDSLGLSVIFEADWFVELRLTAGACISIADASRASINSSGGEGITLALKVRDVEEAHRHLQIMGADPTPIRPHAWNARTFFCHDPEGHRLEFWMEV